MTLLDLELLLPVVALATAFATGPSLLAARGMLRPSFGAHVARLRAPGLALGLAFGAIAASLMAGLSFGTDAAVKTAFLAFLLILAAMDISWRWLPLEWTLPFGLLGLGAAAFSGDLTSALIGAALGGGILLALRLTFQALRGVEALGLGDVWLAAALGAFVGPTSISWLLGAAALLGLALHFAFRARSSNRYGVAFGAHLCAVAPFFLYF
ncbi:MAG: A24 family peptidase [Pseudomonadota bacterium]